MWCTPKIPLYYVFRVTEIRRHVYIRMKLVLLLLLLGPFDNSLKARWRLAELHHGSKFHVRVFGKLEDVIPVFLKPARPKTIGFTHGTARFNSAILFVMGFK